MKFILSLVVNYVYEWKLSIFGYELVVFEFRELSLLR